MDKFVMAALLAFLLAGAILLGTGLTGMVALGHSCCFGPTCPADALCDAAEPILESPVPIGNTQSIWLGSTLLTMASFMIYYYVKRGEHIS